MAGVKKHKIDTHIGDYLRDPISLCSFAAQGLFRSIEFLLSDSERFGYLLTNGKPTTLRTLSLYTRGVGTEKMLGRLLDELVSASVLARTDDGTHYCPTMIEREKRRQAFQKAGKKGGNPNLTLNPRVNPTLNQPLGIGKVVNGKKDNGREGVQGGRSPDLDDLDDDPVPGRAETQGSSAPISGASAVSTDPLPRPGESKLERREVERAEAFCRTHPWVDTASDNRAVASIALMLRSRQPERVVELIKISIGKGVALPCRYALGIVAREDQQQALKPKHSSNEEWLRKPVTQ